MAFFPKDTVTQAEKDTSVLNMQLMGDGVAKTVHVVPFSDDYSAAALALPRIATWISEREPLFKILAYAAIESVSSDQVRDALTWYLGPSLEGFVAVDVTGGSSTPVGACFFRVVDANTTITPPPGAVCSPAIRYWWDLVPPVDSLWRLEQDAFRDKLPLSIETDGTLMLLGPMAVHPSFSNRRIGRAFVERCIVEAKERGCRLIACGTANHFLSKALQFHGFKVAQESQFPNHMSQDGRSVVSVPSVYPHIVYQVLLYHLDLSSPASTTSQTTTS